MVNASEPPQGGGVAGSGHGRHVRTTVAMELATALHHSAQRVEGPREGEVHAKHDGLRAQKRPLPGTRPGLVPEPEPQVSAATVGYVAALEPLLSAPLVAFTAAEAVDFVAVHVLLKDALTQLKERRNMEEEEERRWMAQMKAMTELSRRISRKRKKKRKRKLPRSCSHSSFGRARRRLRQRHARYAGLPGDVPFRAEFPSDVVRPAMLGIMAVMNQKDSTTLVVNHGSGMCRVGFTGYDAPCVMFPSGVAKPKMLCILASMDQIMVQTAETVESPQLQSIQVVDISFVAQRLTTEVPQLPFVFSWSMPLLCRSCLPYPLLSTTGAQGSHSAENRRGPAVAVHQVRRQFPVVVQRLIPMVLVTMGIPQLQFIDKVIDVGYAGPANLGVTVRRQSRSHSCGSSYSFDNVVVIPVVAQMQIPLVRFPLCFSSCSTLIRWSTFVVQVQQFSLNSGQVVACPLCATTDAGWFGVQNCGGPAVAVL